MRLDQVRGTHILNTIQTDWSDTCDANSPFHVTIQKLKNEVTLVVNVHETSGNNSPSSLPFHFSFLGETCSPCPCSGNWSANEDDIMHNMESTALVQLLQSLKSNSCPHRVRDQRHRSTANGSTIAQRQRQQTASLLRAISDDGPLIVQAVQSSDNGCRKCDTRRGRCRHGCQALFKRVVSCLLGNHSRDHSTKLPQLFRLPHQRIRITEWKSTTHLGPLIKLRIPTTRQPSMDTDGDMHMPRTILAVQVFLLNSPTLPDIFSGIRQGRD
mmetsp:Transcript_6590/g.15736  ORF Transcript_6590/g.15736 Transcript_6590/m.15736 type:complete len:270 (+) Transcript_6590:270-1079(+)